MQRVTFSLNRRPLAQLGGLLGLTALLGACSPTLDWRDVEVDPQTHALFPCRPERAERPLALGEATVRAEMRACDAGGLSWSATVLDVGDPGRLTAVLRASRQSLVTRLQGHEASSVPVQIAGMVPNEEARRVVIVGQLGEGRPARVEAIFVARGVQIYQLVVMAQRNAPAQWVESADEFLRSVRWQDR